MAEKELNNKEEIESTDDINVVENDTNTTSEDTGESVENTDESVEETSKEDVETSDKDSSETKKSIKKAKKSIKDVDGLEWKVKVTAIVILITMLIALILIGGNNKATKLSNTINDMLNKNPYIQLIVGDNQYLYMLYNKKGEALVEGDTGGSAFYRKDNKLVSIGSDKATIVEDIDPISLLKNAIQIASKGNGCTITSEEQTNEVDSKQVKTTSYTITLPGKDNIKKLYAQTCSEEYATEAVEMMFSGHEEATDSAITIGINVGENGEIGVICNITFTDKSNIDKETENTNNAENTNEVSTENYNYTMWMFDGYLETFDWELSEEWYTTKEEDIDTWLKLADNLLSDIKEKMSTLIENYGDAKNNVGLIDYTSFLELEETAKLEVISNLCETLANAGYKVTCDNVQLLEGVNTKYADDSYKDWLLLEVVEEVLAENSWLQYSDGTPVEVAQ